MTAKGTYTFDADTAQYNAKVDAMNKKAGGVASAFTQGAKALESMVGPIAIVTAASAGVLAIWNDIAKTQEEAANRLKTAQPARARVLGRAKSPGEVSRISQSIEDTMAGGASEQEAALLQEKLEGSGQAGYRDKYAGLRQAGVDPAAVADSVGNIKDAFKGTDPGDLLDRLGKAAQGSDATMETFTAAVAQAAPAAKLAGIQLNELIAILSQVGGKEIPQMAAGLEQLSKYMIKTGQQGGVLGLADKMAGLTARQQQGRMGSKNVEGLNALSQINANRGAINDALAEQNDSANFLANQRGMVSGADAATRLNQRATNAKALKEQSERRGGFADLAAGERRDMLAKEYGVFGRLFPNLAEGWSRMTGGPVQMTDHLLDGGAGREAFDKEKEDRQIQQEIRDNTRPPPPRKIGADAAHPDSETK